MRQIVVGLDRGVVLEVRDALLDLARRYIDALADIDLPELVQRNLLAEIPPEVGVVDAFLREQCRHVFEFDAVLFGDVAYGLV